MNKCFSCDKPATYENHTQFAGTHYWCADHVPLEDLPDCTPIIDPANLDIKFQEIRDPGFSNKTTITCYITYTQDKIPFEAQGTERTAHRAKAVAFANLNEKLRLYPQEVNDFITTAAKEFTKPQAHEVNKKIQYLLDKLQEEAAEVIQAVSKIRRFGPHNHHPDRQETNLQELTGELEDFQAIVWALEEIKYLDPKPSTTSVIKKFNMLMG